MNISALSLALSSEEPPPTVDDCSVSSHFFVDSVVDVISLLLQENSTCALLDVVYEGFVLYQTVNRSRSGRMTGMNPPSMRGVT